MSKLKTTKSTQSCVCDLEPIKLAHSIYGSITSTVITKHESAESLIIWTPDNNYSVENNRSPNRLHNN